MSSGRHGWLGIGLCASVALHGALASWLAPRAPGAPGPPPLARDAALIDFELVSRGAPPPGRVEVPPPRRPESRPRAKAPEAAPLPATSATSAASAGSATSAEAPTPEPVELAAFPEPGASGTEDGEVTGGDAPGGDGPAGASAGGAGSGGGAPSLAGLLSQRLAAAALRCYPREAVRFRLAGEARLSFCLDDDGLARQVRVVRSSGAAALDRAATGCVLPGALPLPGAAGCYELPVRFSARGR